MGVSGIMGKESEGFSGKYFFEFKTIQNGVQLTRGTVSFLELLQHPSRAESEPDDCVFMQL